MDKLHKDFIKYCDKFMEHALKYSHQASEQIKLEKLACQNGLLSEQNYLKLKNARQKTIITFNNIAYNFNVATTKLNCLNSKNMQLYNMLKNMVEVYEKVLNQ